MSQIEISPNWRDIMESNIPKEKMKWKIQTKSDPPKKHKDSGSYVGLMVCYMDARHCIEAMNKAFGVCWSDSYYHGVMKHEKEYVKEKVIDVFYIKCIVSVVLPDGRTIKREGFASSNDTEPAKSGESNAFKRAVSKFGFGNELYDYPKVYVECTGRDKKFSYPPDAAKMQKALDKVWELAQGVCEEKYFISKDGRLHTYAYAWAGKNIPLGGTTSKKATPSKGKITTVATKKEAPAAPATPEIAKFPPYSAKPNSSWVKALEVWDGNIKESKSGKNIVTLKGKKGGDLYYELGKSQFALLEAHDKHKAWKKAQGK